MTLHIEQPSKSRVGAGRIFSVLPSKRDIRIQQQWVADTEGTYISGTVKWISDTEEHINDIANNWIAIVNYVFVYIDNESPDMIGWIGNTGKNGLG